MVGVDGGEKGIVRCEFRRLFLFLFGLRWRLGLSPVVMGKRLKTSPTCIALVGKKKSTCSAALAAVDFLFAQTTVGG